MTWRRRLQEWLLLAAVVVLAAVLAACLLPDRILAERERVRLDLPTAFAPGVTLTFRPVVVGGLLATDRAERTAEAVLAVPYDAERTGATNGGVRVELVTAEGVRYAGAQKLVVLPRPGGHCQGRLVFRLPFAALEGARLELRQGVQFQFLDNGAVVDLGLTAERVAELGKTRDQAVKDVRCELTDRPR